MRTLVLVFLLLAACISHVSVSLLSAAPSVLLVVNESETGETTYGTCFPYRSYKLINGNYKTYYLTNAHVIYGSYKYGVIHTPPSFRMGVTPLITINNSIQYKIEHASTTVDFAVLSTESAKRVEVLKLSFIYPEYGKEVIAFGYPKGKGVMMSLGIVEFFDVINSMHVANTNTVYGQSGGPVVDRSTGEVIGMITAIEAIRTNGNAFESIWHYQYFVSMHSIFPALKERGLL